MRLVAIVGAAILLVTGTLSAQEHPKIAERPAALKALDGEWVMSGDVMGEPVTYRMVASPTLQGAFTEMHMNDVQVPSQYEARVLVGHDSEWQDRHSALDGQLRGQVFRTARHRDGFGKHHPIHDPVCARCAPRHLHIQPGDRHVAVCPGIGPAGWQVEALRAVHGSPSVAEC